MVNCLTPFLSLPSLCFKWEGEGERMNPSAQNDPSDLFLRLITLLRMCEVRANLSPCKVYLRISANVNECGSNLGKPVT